MKECEEKNNDKKNDPQGNLRIIPQKFKILQNQYL